MNTLKQYAGPKSLAAIQAQASALDLILRRNEHDEFQRQFVVVEWPGVAQAQIFFNTVSGWFFGTTALGQFDSREPPQGESWFDALCDFFLVPLESAEQVPLNLGEAVFESEAAA